MVWVWVGELENLFFTHIPHIASKIRGSILGFCILGFQRNIFFFWFSRKKGAAKNECQEKDNFYFSWTRYPGIWIAWISMKFGISFSLEGKTQLHFQVVSVWLNRDTKLFQMSFFNYQATIMGISLTNSIHQKKKKPTIIFIFIFLY